MRGGVGSCLLAFLCLCSLIQHGISSHSEENADPDTIASEEELAQILDTVLEEKSLEKETDKPYIEDDVDDDDEEEKNEEDSDEDRRSSIKNKLYEILRNLDVEEDEIMQTSDTHHEGQSQTIDDTDQEEEDMNVRAPDQEQGHGWEMDLEDINPDTVAGHLALSFIDVQKGRPQNAEGVDPRNSINYKGENLDSLKLTEDQKKQLGLTSNNDLNEGKRNFLINSRLWPKGIVPYVISRDFNTAERKIIQDAVNEMKTKTCVKFEPKNSKHARLLGHTSYIEFFSGRGCWSYVGKVFRNKQQISLQKRYCVTNEVTIHEMTHAIGMMHEQSRNDRDKYVEILWGNVRGGRSNINMVKDKTQDNNPYDAESVLQYNVNAFGINGKKTIKFKDPRLEFLASEADGLEFYDVMDITTVYKCTEHCTNPPACQNGGFVDFQCKCFCPYGTKGTLCELADTDSVCGGIVDVSKEPQNIETPNYPSNYPTDTKCVWLVKAAQGDLVKMDIHDLHLPANDKHRCYHWLEIRYNLPGQTGPRECGNDKRGSYQTTPDGEGNLMILIFDSKYAKDKAPSKGFRLTVSTVGTGINACSSNPCINGKCSSTDSSSYTCTCKTGFIGKNCDKREPCSSNPCINGKCSSTNPGSYTCACTTGFTGKNCDKRDPCSSNPCINGKCSSTDSSSYTCTCSTGFTGKNCDQGDPCSSNPCVNGKCSSTDSSSYTCTCTTGFTGKNCDQGDPCSSNPCVNGKCSSTNPGSYTCTCTTGFTGKTCDQKEPCSDHPCVYGNCSSTDPSSYTCTCFTGFTGKDCDQVEPNSVTSCSFEDDKCFMSNAQNDDFDWKSISGPTPSRYTGPLHAHSGTKYMYAEMSWPRRPGDIAVLESSVALQTSTERCLTMWYYMYGRKVKTLQVLYEGTGVSRKVLWSQTGNKGRTWWEAYITIPAVTNLKIFIEAVRGDKWNSDIAIDDLELKEGRCPTILTCSFEDDKCFMTNAKGDDFDWTSASGRTPTFFTGPRRAHRGIKYLYAEMSRPRKPDDIAVLESSVAFLTSTERCLTMWYCMYGRYVKTLRVSYQGTGVSKTELWSEAGNNGRNWLEVNIDIPAVTNLKLFIEAKRGQHYRSDIAIDDLKLTEGSCFTKK